MYLNVTTLYLFSICNYFIDVLKCNNIIDLFSICNYFINVLEVYITAPEYMLNYFEEVKNLHNHNTRMAASGGYTLPKINNDTDKRTFRYGGAHSWNKLPPHVQKSQNKNSFKTDCVKYI